MRVMQVIKQIVEAVETARDLPEDAAYALFGAMLDGGVAELELGAALIALRTKPESSAELLGFQRALRDRAYTLAAPVASTRPVVLPAYGGARTAPNLLPLLGLLLCRMGVPVVFHGTLEGGGRVASVYILRELGVLPSATLQQARAALQAHRIAFVPTAVLCPGLATLLALRNRLGVRNSAHLVAKLLDPFAGESAIVAGASVVSQLERIGEVLGAIGARALLLASTQGEPFANPSRRPRIEQFDRGVRQVLFEEEVGPIDPVGLPASIDARATADWIRLALAGQVPIPHPLVNQLACCLVACDYTDDIHQAKAIAAVEAGGFGPGGGRRDAPRLSLHGV